MKSIGIEELLSWAFVHELPKGGGEGGLTSPHSAWGAISGFSQLMTVIDYQPDRSGMFFEQGDPHPDALLVGQAVQALIPYEPEPATDYVSDWLDPYGLLPEAVSSAVQRYTEKSYHRRRCHTVHLVIASAVLGRGPDWRAAAPRQRLMLKRGKPAWFMKKRVRDSFGRSHRVIVDGYDGRAQRPKRGAFRRYELTRDPIADILSRLDWNLWVDSLDVLFRVLSGTLASHRLRPSEYCQNPWDERPKHALLRVAAAIQTHA
ncbi:MAG: hypothetical protein GY807_03465 [Gammaproteobacteria bacterium]|nr:hypothetical protein [Gammaproteobacteria bacterium]